MCNFLQTPPEIVINFLKSTWPEYYFRHNVLIRVWLTFTFNFYIYCDKYGIYNISAAPLYLDLYNARL